MLNKRKLCWVFFMLFAFTGYTSVFSQNLDIDILKGINPEHPNSLYWRNTSNSAYYVAGAATFGSLAVGLFSGNKTITHNGIETAINLGATVLVTDIIKISVNRTRPADRYPNDVFVLSPTHNQSFPSGHTSLAFATATTLALQYHKWYVT
ncbi:MAG TPA: phosphatase PAP2 family protein, partial [Mucilaginibacter sp.]